MFGFNKKKRIKLNLTKAIPNESDSMKNYRIKVTHEFENLLTVIDQIRLDKKMSPEEKYSIMMASLYMVNVVSDELLESPNFFGSDKQFKGIDRETKKMLKGSVPNYIG